MRASQVTELKRMLPINHEFKNGDTIGFMLDLRDNARHHSEDDSENLALAPPGRGKLTLRYKGKSYLVASNLGGELWPVFNMDNISEQLSLDFVIDGEDGDGTAVIRRTLEVPTRSTCENLFQRVDGTRSSSAPPPRGSAKVTWQLPSLAHSRPYSCDAPSLSLAFGYWASMIDLDRAWPVVSARLLVFCS